jgi:hypothetical protein
MSVIWATLPARICAPPGYASSGAGKAACSSRSASSLIFVKAFSCKVLSTIRKTAVDKPSSNRLELCAIASSTGCTSVGEPLITRRISLVAVCRSSASWVSLNKRAFSIAMTAWSAKVCSSATSLSENRPGSARQTATPPMTSPLRIIGTATELRQPPSSAAAFSA